MARKVKEERLEKNLSNKKVYHFIDSERGLNVKCREVFKKSNKEVHYPFNRRGEQRYQNIRKITYDGYKNQVPVGFLKSPSWGLGFNKDIAALFYRIQEEIPSVDHIIISKGKKSAKLNSKELRIKYEDLKIAIEPMRSIQNRHKDEVKKLSNNLMAKILPDYFGKEEESYTKGQLQEFIDKHSLTASKLSNDDFLALADLISLIPSDHALVAERKLVSTKRKIEKIFVEDLIRGFEQRLGRKSNSSSLEGEWQEFLKDNILFFNFGYVERFEKERIQGDKKLNIPDFILLNSLGYVDVFEIKTHLSQLLSYDKGRNNFHWHSEASKAISQAENYIDAIVKEEDTLIKNIRDEYGITFVNAVRPTIFVIASSRGYVAGSNTESYKGKTKAKMWNDYRRLNNSLKNIHFVLYDELLDTFQNMINKLSNE